MSLSRKPVKAPAPRRWFDAALQHISNWRLAQTCTLVRAGARVTAERIPAGSGRFLQADPPVIEIPGGYFNRGNGLNATVRIAYPAH